MTKKNEELSEQLNFYFWLGEDGNIESVDAEGFKQKQEQWQGQRPSDATE